MGIRDSASPAPGDDQPSIAIVGGSITGPTLALLLHQAGFTNVSVLEASPRPHAQAGGVIGLEHSALATLDAIGIPQREVVPFPSERVVAVHVSDRQEVGRVHTIYPGRNTGWHLLNTALLNRLPDGWLQPNRAVRSLTVTDDGKAQLEFARGQAATADMVVFADGRRSTGRRLLDPSRPLHYAGYVAWRGQLPHGLPELSDFTRYEPHSTQFNCFPILRKDGSIGVDWTFYLNMTGEQFTELLGAAPTQRTYVLPHQIGPEVRAMVLEQARRLLPPAAAAMVEATEEWNAAPIVDIDPPQHMVHPIGAGHAVLLGDALAPVRPHTARGANHGIDQAHGLSIALSQHLHHDADLGAALNGWQHRYLPAVHHALELGPRLGSAMGLGVTPSPELVPA
ncbi:FAD-dependent monooxygenase [Nonomuraea aridisoli]|uniref:Monooxygenase n=1 Tax=Nonomuraea aridisoli TaxID=2070368 RepID=A0A2W2EAD2_9ACTN|nr:FAD-dependent monooxygenase [Nonomuraea aridisoli]PZG08928.1 monooxygenase [Nonomuraea aridisoli]